MQISKIYRSIQIKRTKLIDSSVLKRLKFHFNNDAMSVSLSLFIPSPTHFSHPSFKTTYFR